MNRSRIAAKVEKIILMSVMAVTVIVPSLAARRNTPSRSARGMLLLLLFLYAAYVTFVVSYYVDHYVPEWMP